MLLSVGRDHLLSFDGVTWPWATRLRQPIGGSTKALVLCADKSVT
jgi:hypothetical protein